MSSLSSGFLITRFLSLKEFHDKRWERKKHLCAAQKKRQRTQEAFFLNPLSLMSTLILNVIRGFEGGVHLHLHDLMHAFCKLLLSLKILILMKRHTYCINKTLKQQTSLLAGLLRSLADVLTLNYFCHMNLGLCTVCICILLLIHTIFQFLYTHVHRIDWT